MRTYSAGLRPQRALAAAVVLFVLAAGCSDNPDPIDAIPPESSIALSAGDSTAAPSEDASSTSSDELDANVDPPPSGEPEPTTTAVTSSTAQVNGSTSANPSTSAPASTTPATPPVVDWSNVVPAEVVLDLDVLSGQGRTRAWLIRFDDRLTLDVAQGMALEAEQYGIVDENGALELFADGSWIGDCDECLDPNDVGGAATLMELMLVGGFFGEYDPDPTSPDGHELILRTFSGELGRESEDQRFYLVGSSRLGPMSDWEAAIVGLLPELGASEYLAAIAFEHPCGSDPAPACF